MLVNMVKEVLYYHFQKRIWKDTGVRHAWGIDFEPDLTAYKKLRTELRKDDMQPSLYYLDAVVQGSMPFHTERHLKVDLATNQLVCNLCGEVIAGEDPWRHYAIDCCITAGYGSNIHESEHQNTFNMHLDRARHETENSQKYAAFWLRGLMPAELPYPLSLDYEYNSTFDKLDIQGAFVGGGWEWRAFH